MVGFIPFSSNPTLVQAQSKKKNPAQASKYEKRGNAKAKKKDYRGALDDYKRASTIPKSYMPKPRGIDKAVVATNNLKGRGKYPGT